MGVLLTRTATKDSRTDHWPDSEGSVGPTCECVSWVVGSWRLETYGHECDAAEESEGYDDPATAE